MWTFRAALLLLAVASAGAARAQEHVMAFGSPAAHFTESVPLGNGRLGAMVFGGVDAERLVLNESGMCSGSPQDADRPDAAAALAEIRRLLLEGRNAEAEQLVDRNFTCAGAGSGHGSGARVPDGAYQVLGNLRLAFTHPGDAPHEGYRRELDLQEAVARVTYRKGGVAYVREVFVSAPDEVVVLRVSADRPRAVSFDLQLDRSGRATAAARNPRGLALTGQLEDGRGGGGVQVRGADEVVLLLAALTDIRSFAGRRADDPEKAALADLERASISTEGGGTYPNLFDAHPPFQIDGNFGAAAGIAEMLVQSHGEEIRLLPALPAAWAEGEVKGLRARGGFEVDVRWAQGRLREVVLRSLGGTRTRIRHGERVTDLTLAPGERRRLGPDLR